MKYRLFFWLIRMCTFPVLFLSYHTLHKIGRKLGTIAYFCMPDFRKRSLSNLALATDLHLTESDIKRLATESFQNLMITCLEYPKLAREKHIQSVVRCENPEEADKIRKSGTGLIFFCGHQANWELLFLEGTARMPGVAIGRPVKNDVLYRWVVSMRQKYGGKMITPKQAVREGLRALKQGAFLGIVGDQGMPDSGYCSPFFGRNAWTSPLPALLAYKTGSPILVATTKRTNDLYRIHYSSPIWPDSTKPLEQEVNRMMREALKLLEDSIREAPGQWLWQHNRWKQQTPERLKRRYRYESIGVIFPENEHAFKLSCSLLETLRTLYPHEFFTLLIPKDKSTHSFPKEMTIRVYASQEELLIRDYSLKLIFDFTSNPRVRSHFLRLATFEVVTLKYIHSYAKHHHFTDPCAALQHLINRDVHA